MLKLKKCITDSITLKAGITTPKQCKTGEWRASQELDKDASADFTNMSDVYQQMETGDKI